SRLFMAFGGYYDFKPFNYQPLSLLQKALRKPAYWLYQRDVKRHSDFSDRVFVFQHDNFRFWEVLYSGAVAINLNLSYWHFVLPVMPEDGRHYIGISKFKEDIECRIERL